MKIGELTIGSNLYNDAIKLRYELFFQQHGLPMNVVIDEHENASKHVAVIRDKSLIAYGRLTNLGEGICHLSQIVVQPKEQRKGYGTMILKELIKRAESNGCGKIIINARATATELYEKLGFICRGDEFSSKKTGVPHVQMFYRANTT